MVSKFATAMGVILLLVPQVGLGAEATSHQHTHEEEPRCPDPKTVSDVIRCLTTSHNSIQVSSRGVSASDLGISAASLWSNPDLQVQGMRDPKGASYQVQTTLMFEPPFLGSRLARIEAAKSTSERSKAAHELLQSSIKVEGILKLTRLRQILREMQINELSRSAISKALSAIHSRGRLTPELETTESIFSLASNEATIAHSFLADERREIGHFFEVHTGYSFSQLEKVLREEYGIWPKLDKEKPYQANSPETRVLNADLKLSHASLDFERSKTFSGFRLGPMFQTEMSDIRGQENLLGIQLDIPLPLFNVNGAGTAQARSEIVKSETALQLGKAEEEHERLEQIESYEHAVKVLKSLPSQADLDKRIARGFGQYQRGLINAPHLMELYRQGVEFLKSRHERERQALVSLWKVYFIENRASEEMP